MSKDENKAIIFDYDGVIVDSYPTLFKVYKKMAQIIGVKQFRTMNDLRKVYCFTHHDVDAYWGIKTKEEKAQQSKLYFDLTSRYKKDIPLVPGIKEVIKKLARKYKLGIASATSKKLIRERLSHHGLLSCFNHITGHEDVTRHKPAPDLLNACLKKLKVKPEHAIYVGDMAADIMMGKEAHVKTVAFCSSHGWNNIDYVKMQKPDIIIKKPEQLLTISP